MGQEHYMPILPVSRSFQSSSPLYNCCQLLIQDHINLASCSLPNSTRAQLLCWDGLNIYRILFKRNIITSRTIFIIFTKTTMVTHQHFQFEKQWKFSGIYWSLIITFKDPVVSLSGPVDHSFPLLKLLQWLNCLSLTSLQMEFYQHLRCWKYILSSISLSTQAYISAFRGNRGTTLGWRDLPLRILIGSFGSLLHQYYQYVWGTTFLCRKSWKQVWH